MKTNSPPKSRKPAFAIRVHLTDGSVESFAPPNEAEAQKLWDRIEPSRLFDQTRLVLAGKHFKSVFATAQILRVDFIQDTYECWRFPGGYSDVVELSEAEFKKLAHLDQPELMAKREEPTPVGDLLVSFLKLRLAGSKPLFLMIELPVKQPDENLSFMKFLLSKGGFHLRLRGGGIGVVNLSHLAGYTVYPGVQEVPIDTWLVEPLLNEA